MRRRDTYWSLFHKPEKRQLDDLKTDSIETIYEVLPAKDRADWLIWREGFANWKPLEDFPQLVVSLRKGGMMNAPSQPAPQPAQRDVATRLAEPAAARPSSGPATGVPGSGGVAGTPSRGENAQAAPTAPRGGGDRAPDTDRVGAEPAVRPTAKETTVQDRLARQGSINETVDFDIMAETELGDRDVRYRKKWEVRILTDGKPFVNTTVDVSNRGMSLKEALPKGLPRYFNVEIHAGEMVIPLICSEIKSQSGPSTRIKIEVNHNPNLLQTALLM